MRIVRLQREILTKHEYCVDIPNTITDQEAEDYALNEVMYNLSKDYTTGKEDVLCDEFVDAELIK